MRALTVRVTVVLLALLFGLVGPGWAAADDPLLYRLTYPGSTSDRVRVSLEVPEGTDSRVFLMPRAVPMGYSEQPYDAFVSEVRALGLDGEPFEVGRGEGPRWHIAADESMSLASVSYEVDLRAMEMGILSASDASKVRTDYVGILGYSVFGYLEGQENRSIHLELEVPEDWPVFTTLAPKAEPDKGRVSAPAADFYALADSQIAMGPQLEVLQAGVEPPLFVAGYAEAPWDLDLPVDVRGLAPLGRWIATGCDPGRQRAPPRRPKLVTIVVKRNTGDTTRTK